MAYQDDWLITRQEILKGEECPPEYEDNLLELLIKGNKIRDAFGRPMIVTSGFRTKEDHLRIYEKQIKAGKHVPMGSKHLYCQAVDISDPNKILQKWCLENEKLLAEVGVWMEHFSHTSTWVHFQIVPPASGNRFFKIKT